MVGNLVGNWRRGDSSGQYSPFLVWCILSTTLRATAGVEPGLGARTGDAPPGRGVPPVRRLDSLVASRTAALGKAPHLPSGETLRARLAGHFVSGATGCQMLLWSLRPDGAHVLRAYVQEHHGYRQIAEGYHPFIYDLQIGDVDHDGLDEMVVGVQQRSKLDPRVLRRIHVYSIDARRGFRPRWRGSELSRPFRRFVPLPRGGHGTGCDLVALEKNLLAAYRDFLKSDG